jgi:hypothetical protein
MKRLERKLGGEVRAAAGELTWAPTSVKNAANKSASGRRL